MTAVETAGERVVDLLAQLQAAQEDVDTKVALEIVAKKEVEVLLAESPEIRPASDGPAQALSGCRR